ncbi:hypothetical protein GS982_01175 [Rhodococcus hoagii]|uniref:Uncharacterized protein n=1 Tax=Rhodococcus hoagii TaxID=43767 RepID=A0A9Q5EVM8_RHOHA|nr:hypothetical protein [Prescottella equi]NKT77219.1 hypothetical protein [Prescottella equi]NKZ81003.1 hypothetical protein [Prescottella equi]
MGEVINLNVAGASNVAINSTGFTQSITIGGTPAPSERDQLQALLEDDYFELCEVDYEWDGFVTVAREEGDNRRWSRYNTIVTRGPSGQYYRWGYDEGLTEYQENTIYPNEIELVDRVENVVTETVVTYVRSKPVELAAAA